jgi:hypothetical protein
MPGPGENSATLSPVGKHRHTSNHTSQHFPVSLLMPRHERNCTNVSLQAMHKRIIRQRVGKRWAVISRLRLPARPHIHVSRVETLTRCRAVTCAFCTSLCPIIGRCGVAERRCSPRRDAREREQYDSSVCASPWFAYVWFKRGMCWEW